MFMKKLSFLLLCFCASIQPLFCQDGISIDLELKANYSVMNRGTKMGIGFTEGQFVPKLGLGLNYRKRDIQVSFGVTYARLKSMYGVYILLPGEEIPGYSFIAQREIRNYEISSHTRLLIQEYINLHLGAVYIADVGRSNSFTFELNIGPEIILIEKLDQVAILPNRGESRSVKLGGYISSWSSHFIKIGFEMDREDEIVIKPMLEIYSNSMKYQDIHIGIGIDFQFGI